jgi:hypothetical protein
MRVTARCVLLFSVFVSVLSLASHGAGAQCYPGLACPTGTVQTTPEAQPTVAASTAGQSSIKGGPQAGEQTSAATVAPAYTCKDSKSASELVICQHQDLAVLDIRLNATYSGVQSRMTDAELKVLRDQQRGCIKALYVSRLQQLSTR